jgi:hypothetical protein
MPDSPLRGPETLTQRLLWWLGVLAVLGVVSIALVAVARHFYDEDHPDTFESSLAKGVLLNGVLVAVLGAVVALVLSIAAEIRSGREAAADKRLGLFRRMRDAHLRVVLTQQILRARRDSNTYHEQMRALQAAVKDMGEIREEVNVSGRRLYDVDDRRMIMKGIDLLGIYLNQGVSEYVNWCKTVGPSETPDRRPGRGSWVAELVDEHDDDALIGRDEDRNRPGRLRLLWRFRKRPRLVDKDPPEPGDEGYAPPGGMPPKYENGLEQSKLMMRLYVYGASRKKREDERKKILKRVQQRADAEKAAGPPATRAEIPTPG